MGQLLLGFRSLIIKAVVFLVMAALLAWALGGTLWPRPTVIEYEPIALGDATFRWQLLTSGRDSPRVQWRLIEQRDGEEDQSVLPGVVWLDAAGLLVSGNSLYAAGRAVERQNEESWIIVEVRNEGGEPSVQWHAAPDRLALEIQLARLRVGLPLLSPADLAEHRDRLVAPASE